MTGNRRSGRMVLLLAFVVSFLVALVVGTAAFVLGAVTERSQGDVAPFTTSVTPEPG
jgi:serine/threonine-protein kinase